ncbi:MAG: excinuclease ABC subunit UvrC [Chloracidobacterium sp.]|nr:excinuclease ABC subunit UvrC [Chloracidobacterium sp.]MDW8216696.1 excinuclease ABC subunit UvrC [Acidobacteriota bacterium]
MTLAEKLSSLSTGPGCYLHKDAHGTVIYVGKAKNLRARVRSYFHPGRRQDPKTRELVARIHDIECIVTDTEVEALVLESNLIKQYKPRYNVLLKDDKQYPHLKLTLNEPFPRVIKTRRVLNDGALYHGPYLPASLAHQTLKLVNQMFQLRTCDIEIDGKRERPCLEYHIKRCLGPCVRELCSEAEYAEAVRDVRLFFEGKNKELLAELEARMLRASDELRFEQAARYRDQLRLVERLSETQKMMLKDAADVDIFGYHREGARLALQLFTMREGRIIGRREFFWEDLPDDETFDAPSFLGEALTQYYALGNYVPHEVHAPHDFADRDVLEAFLSERRGSRVRILTPQRGQKRELIELVERNARVAFDQRFRTLKPDMAHILEELADVLELPRFPARIECFDISHLQGAEAVASLVVFENGRPAKEAYRKFRIKTATGGDDFASMREVIGRRYARLLREAKPLPDLVLVDGGKGQLSAAAEALRALDLEALPLAAIAKREEVIFVKGRENDPIRLERRSPVLHLVQMLRDEAHRFAVAFHRQRRAQRDFDSELLAIPGIGPKLKNRLLRNLGSLDNIRRASVAELTPFVGETRARAIRQHFHPEEACERPDGHTQTQPH